ncbi:MAG: tRNA dihydrouridine(20/20a) synthase DusA [Rhodospirillales bacterium]|nr:tRNA dihydrouridine(20/20a) synthase DusA [Rhodospirillales bacterium]
MLEATARLDRPRALDRRLSVAPMMQRTDRHFRRFMRRLTRCTLLYTEMIPLGAILHGPRERRLRLEPAEQPVALQVGGSDPAGLSTAAKLAERYGYREINLNCGCPSNAVQDGGFGVVLMRTPARTAECVRAMVESTDLPVTVKARIGLDTDRSEAFLDDFVGAAADAGCRSFIIHARSAWLTGLNPQQNRTIPPLDYARVRRLARSHANLDIVVNGGIQSLSEVTGFLAEGFSGVMVGRAAWDHPWLFAEADQRVFGAHAPPLTREEALRAHAPYIARALADGEPFHRLARPLAGLYRRQPGARRWRRALAEHQSLHDALGSMAVA